LPEEAAILLEKALERAATRSTVQPDRDFIDWLTELGLEDEKEGTRVVVLLDGDEARVELAEVEVYVRQVVDEIRYWNVRINMILRNYSGITYVLSPWKESDSRPLGGVRTR
jgi:hypothetical protein